MTLPGVSQGRPVRLRVMSEVPLDEVCLLAAMCLQNQFDSIRPYSDNALRPSGRTSKASSGPRCWRAEADNRIAKTQPGP